MGEDASANDKFYMLSSPVNNSEIRAVWFDSREASKTSRADHESQVLFSKVGFQRTMDHKRETKQFKQMQPRYKWFRSA